MKIKLKSYHYIVQKSFIIVIISMDCYLKTLKYRHLINQLLFF